MMKKLVYLLLVIFVVSCQTDEKIDGIIVSGNVTNGQAKMLSVKNSDGTVNELISINETGVFNDTLSVNDGFYTLYNDKKMVPIYLQNGFNLKLAFDPSNFESTITFEGNGGDFNNYLQEKKRKEAEMIGKSTEVYKLDEAAYKSKFDSVRNVLSSLLNSYSKIDKNLKEKELKSLEYDYLNKLSIYQRYHSFYTKNPSFKVSETFLKELDNLDYDNASDFTFSKSYKDLVNGHYNLKAAKSSRNDTIPYDIAFLKEVSKAPSDVIKNSLMFDSAIYGITYTEDLEEFYSTFMENCTNQEYKDKITESYNKLKKVAAGEPSPKFFNYENIKGGTTSLDDLKGSYIYIDVWATWCGPCIREIPALKELEKEYHKKNIKFVSISVDSEKDHEKWKEMIAEKELKGIQLYADKSWNSEFIQEYSIKGIPRFIVIDPAGKIINSNAPRPSDSRLKELFNNLDL